MLKPYWWKPLAVHKDIYRIQQLRPWIVLQKFNKGFTNFGDELNGFIVSEIFGNNEFNRSLLSEANFFLIGSILELTQRSKTESLHVVGSGMRRGEKFDLPRNVHAHAFRGKLTAAHVGHKESIVLGDPALILSKYRDNNRPAKSGLRVFAPHFSLFALNQYSDTLQFFQDQEFQILWPNSDPRDALALIGSADLLISSALHPLIVADAYGIPAIYMENQAPFESSFKYQDYCSIFQDGSFWPSTNLIDLSSGKDVSHTLLEKSAQRVSEIQGTIDETSANLIDIIGDVINHHLT